MFNEFIDMLKESSGSGARVFVEWTTNPDKFLKKSLLPVDEILRNITDEERKKIAPLVDYFTKMSFYFLFKKLEEGVSDYSFELNMKNEATGETLSLINDEIDREIRTLIQNEK